MLEKLRNKIKNENKMFNNLIKIFFVIAAIIFAMPSICYIIRNNTILNFDKYYKFLLNDIDITKQTLAYILSLTILTILYFLIIKHRQNMFKSNKNMLFFIGIISIIFIAVVPFTSSDIFYYLGVGRIDGTYNQNPYYTTIKQFVLHEENVSNLLKADTVLLQGYNNPWSDTTVVYGPIWTLICKFVATMSFGNIDIGLVLLKIINVIVHIFNCYLIYKISNKKIFVLLYGLNPFILIEGIACVHNDIFVILFTLLALYFLIKKKNILLSVILLALGAAIKYFTIIILPFIIIYHFRKEKPGKRFLRCIEYGMIFTITVFACYLLYIRDFQVFSGLFVQQEKIAKSIYVVIREYFSDIPGIIEKTTRTLLQMFVIIYFFTCVVLLNKKEIKLTKELKTVNYFIMGFIFLLITNFQPWYIMWLFPLIMWQKSDIIKLEIGLSIASQFANSIFLLYNEQWTYGTPFIFIMTICGFLIIIINEKKSKNRIKNAYIRRKKVWRD